MNKNAKYELANPNLYQADHEREPVQSKRTASLRCPHCMHLGNFSSAFSYELRYTKWNPEKRGVNQFQSSIMLCPNMECKGFVLAIFHNNELIESQPPEIIDFDSSNLPRELLLTLEEAISCHAKGAYRASAMMIRRLLEEICEKNGAEGQNLHARLSNLKTKVTLPVELFEAMNELKLLGNDAAHIVAKNYNSIDHVQSRGVTQLPR